MDIPVRVLGQRAAGALRPPPAVRFAYGYSEGVKLVEEADPMGCRLGGEGRLRQVNQRLIAPAVAPRRGSDQLVPFGDAAQVLVGHRNRVVQGIKQDRVGGLRAYAGQQQQTAPESGGRRGRELIERTGKLRVQQFNEGLERRRFARLEAGRANQIPQLIERSRAQALQCQGSCPAQILQRSLDGLPGGVLRQIGAENDFEGGLRGPPVLRAVSLRKPIVHPAQAAGFGAEVVAHG